MHIITRKRLNDFSEKHPDAKPGLQHWYRLWPSVSSVLYVPHTEREYFEVVDLLDDLVDEVGEDESHPLASLMEVLSVLIEKYEDDHVSEITDL